MLPYTNRSRICSDASLRGLCHSAVMRMGAGREPVTPEQFMAAGAVKRRELDPFDRLSVDREGYFGDVRFVGAAPGRPVNTAPMPSNSIPPASGSDLCIERRSVG